MAAGEPVVVKRTLLAVCLLAATAVALPAGAAPKPQVVDPKGDALDRSTAHDVVSVLFTRTKTASGAGFQVQLTLAGPQSSVPGVNYAISARTEECGEFTINWAPGGPVIKRSQVTMPCGEPSETTGDPYTILNVPPTVKGNVLTWKFKRKMFPKELQDGEVFSDLAVNVQQNDPLTSILGPSAFTSLADYDVARGTTAFTW